jgi:type IV pilus assembly protein PilQ
MSVFTTVNAAEGGGLITLSFSNAPLGTVLRVIGMKTGKQFTCDAVLGTKPIELNLKDVTAQEAIDALLNTYNLYYVRQPNTEIYVIKSKSEGMVTTVSQIFYLNYAQSKEMDTALRPNLTKSGSLSSDARTNSLIVTDVADNIQKIADLIQSLDLPTQQVELEAKIIDMNIGNSFDVGTQIRNIYKTDQFHMSPLDYLRTEWTDANGVKFGGMNLPANYAGSDLPAGDYRVANGVLQSNSISPQTSWSQQFGTDLASGGSLGFAILSGDYNIEGALELLKTDTNSKLLTNPRLLVMNNQEANINIIEEIPYSEATISGNNTIITTQFKQVGIKLLVRPLINRDGTIVLNVEPEQSFRTGESLNGVPVVSTSKAKTTFMLRDGETAVIGGLIRETTSDTQLKIPLLGDIPIIGYLFKRQTNDKVRTELTIFITARVAKK